MAPPGAVRLRWLRKLYVQVLLAVVAGALAGYFHPSLAVGLKPFGDAFVKAIKVVVTPIIFTTVVVGIATMADIGRIARVGLKALVYFEAISTLALIIGLVVGNVWQVGTGVHANAATLDGRSVAGYVTGASHMTVTDFLLNIIPDTFIEPFARGDVLPVLFLAVIFGLALCHLGQRARPLTDLLDLVSHGPVPDGADHHGFSHRSGRSGRWLLRSDGMVWGRFWTSASWSRQFTLSAHCL